MHYSSIFIFNPTYYHYIYILIKHTGIVSMTSLRDSDMKITETLFRNKLTVVLYIFFL